MQHRANCDGRRFDPVARQSLCLYHRGPTVPLAKAGNTPEGTPIDQRGEDGWTREAPGDASRITSHGSCPRINASTLPRFHMASHRHFSLACFPFPRHNAFWKTLRMNMRPTSCDPRQFACMRRCPMNLLAAVGREPRQESDMVRTEHGSCRPYPH